MQKGLLKISHKIIIKSNQKTCRCRVEHGTGRSLSKRRRRKRERVRHINTMLLRGIFSLAAVVVAVSCNAAAASTILVDSSGSLTKSTIPTSQNLVALLSSPGTPNLFTNSNTVSIDENIISAPGANLEESGLLGSGIGAAAAASVAGSVILTGVTIADVEAGLDGTRHGRTLAELFSSVLRLGKRSKPTSLIIAVQTDKEASLDSSEVEGCVQEIFDSVAAAIGSLDELDDYFDITSTTVTSSEDVSKIMSSAQSAAKDAAKPQGIFGDIYKQIQKASDDADPTPVAEAILSCNDAYSRASRTSRAKIAAWKHRVSRNLMVNNFGSQVCRNPNMSFFVSILALPRSQSMAIRLSHC